MLNYDVEDVDDDPNEDNSNARMDENVRYLEDAFGDFSDKFDNFLESLKDVKSIGGRLAQARNEVCKLQGEVWGLKRHVKDVEAERDNMKILLDQVYAEFHKMVEAQAS